MESKRSFLNQFSRMRERIGHNNEVALAAGLGALAMLVLLGWSNNFGIGYTNSAPPALLAPVSSAGVIDDRARFRQIFCALNADHGSQFRVHRPCSEALQKLDGEAAPTSLPIPAPSHKRGALLHIVIIPGMFGQCVKTWALPFEDGAAYLRRQGYPVDTIDVDGRSSSAVNAGIISRELPLLLRPGERLLIIGYSKGMSDILETFALYPNAIPPGSAVVSLAGIVAGTPIADHYVKLYRTFSSLPMPSCEPGDHGALESVTRRHRIAWLADHPLPLDRTYFSVAAFADYAHISWPLRQTYNQLATFDARNDGQVLYTDAILPHSHLLGYVNADHWAVALPLARKVPALRPVFAGRNDYPREILLEAIVRSVEEQLRLSS